MFFENMGVTLDLTFCKKNERKRVVVERQS